ELSGAWIADAMALAGRRKHRVAAADAALDVANAKPAFAVDDEIDLVGAGMSMRLLLLAGIEPIDVTEHPLGLEQVHLGHLLRCKRRDGAGILEKVHCGLLKRRSRGSMRMAELESQPGR